MEFDEIVVKETPGLCRCCLSEGCYKDLSTEYNWMEDQEIYADMLLECFDISISQHMEGPNGPNRLICEVCITRLRDACNFKKQVLESEKKFVDMVGRGEFKSRVASYPESMKTELCLEPQPVEETEIEYLDDDVDYDDGSKDDVVEPTVSEDITVSMLPVKGKRGRPKKTIVKPEKKKPKVEDKAKSKIAKVSDSQIVHSNDRQRKYEISKLLTAIIECSTIMPFRWCANKFMCFYCGCPFVDSSKLKQHTLEEHNDAKLKNVLRNNRCSRIKLDISDISCKICPKPISTVEEFLDHIWNVHDIKIDRNLGDSLFSFKLNDESMQCLDCGQSFRFFGPLLTHVHRFHAKVNTFLCDICGHGFVAKVNLYSHVRNVHSNYNFKWENCKITGIRRAGEVNLKCPKCPEYFRSSYLRKQHLALVHEVKGSQFKCEECPRIFTSKSRLVEHKLRTHLKEKTLACEICGFKVFSKDLLKRHMVKHDDNRPFQCEFCKKAFQRKKTLDIHRRIHTNDRRYVCKECGKAFVQCTSLKLHMRVHHNTGNT